MSSLAVGAAGVGALLLLTFLRMPLAFALGLVGALGTGLIAGWPTFIYIVGTAPFTVLNSYNLSVIPVFILMGALAIPTGLANDLVRGLNAAIGHYRGGLAIGSVLSCLLFGRISGSDIADLSAMSKIAVPGMLRHGYGPRLAAGAVASGSTLAILMPPSVPLVLYATLTETSIGRIFAGGLIPGLVLTAMFIAVIYVWARWRPGTAPRSQRLPWRQRLHGLWGLWSTLAIFIVMIGGIYAGFFSPTEAASVGAGSIILLGISQRRLTWGAFLVALRDAVRLSAVIFLVLIGVSFFHYFLDAVHLPAELGRMISGMNIAPSAVMAIILIALILLGCVMDSLTILLVTVPILHPIAVALGFDAIWFGIVMAMVVQLGLIHPPFGLNVFILCSIVPEITIRDAFWGCAPFVVANILLIFLVLAIPSMITWLPNLLFK